MSSTVTDSNTPEIDAPVQPESSRGPATLSTARAGEDEASLADYRPPGEPIDLPEPTAPQTSPRRRAVGMLVYAGLLAGLIKVVGLPTDPVAAFGCLWAATIAWNNGRRWHAHLRFLRDWSAVVILLVVYNFSRGYADNGITPHITEMIHADRWMFGWATGGEVPSYWLQSHLYHPLRAQWYDVLVSFVYFSHFLTAPTVAAILWLRNRGAWASFVRRWFTLSALGLATYFIYPAMPPWLASQDGYLPTIVHGVATRGWYAIGMRHGGNLLNAAQLDAANLVAAMPSLHSAFALLISVFFMMRTRKRWWPLLLAYPLAMTFTLVYAGEHYVIDVLVGWAYVAATFLLVWLAERGWRRLRRARRPAAGEIAPTSGLDPVPERADLA